MADELALFWRATWRRTLLLLPVPTLPLLFIGRGPTAAGVVLGGLLLLADIYLLRAPLEIMVKRVALGRRPWILAFSIARLLLVGGLLLLFVRFRIADVFGLIVGVTVPLIAIISLFVVGRPLLWKV